jgi:hypothetical protein
MLPHKTLLALLTLTLFGCSTTEEPKPQPVVPRISEALKSPCAPSLPPLEVQPGDKDIRPELLNNRAESELTFQECAAKHRGVLRAVGVSVEDRRKARRETLNNALKAQSEELVKDVK